MNKFVIMLMVCMFLIGCRTTYTIHQRYDYEGVYKPNVDIYIGTNKIDRSKTKERVWIISDATLAYLLDEAKQSVR